MTNNMSDWVYPVDYYFLVDFQNMYGLKFQASFFEVSNIGWTINTEEKVTDSNECMLIPKNISNQKVSLKRQRNCRMSYWKDRMPSFCLPVRYSWQSDP